MYVCVFMRVCVCVCVVRVCVYVRMYVSCRHGNYDSLQLSHLFPGFLLPTPTAEMCGRRRAMGPAWSPLVVPQRETGLQTALK